MITVEAENLFVPLPDEPATSDGYLFEEGDNRSETASDHETRGTETKDKTEPSVSSAKIDDMATRYFGEIRQHDLLSLEAERVLWGRIEHHKARVRRALCLAPIALHTLTRVWNQIKHGEISLQEVIRLSPEDDRVWADPLVHLSDTVAQLHDLASALRHDHTGRGAVFISATDRRSYRRERARLLRQWVTTWEVLPLLPTVYDTLQLDLKHAAMVQPNNASLGASQYAWTAAKQQLDEARAQMLRANLRLAVHVAMRFRDSSVPLLDLIQEGNLGLMRAIEKFEPQRGVKFITYAHWWVRQAIGRAIINQGRTVRLPTHVLERHHKARAATDRLWQLSGQAPTTQDIGNALGWTPQEVEQIDMAIQGILPLDQRLPDGDRTISDLIQDPTAQNPTAAAEGEQLQHCLQTYFDSLKPREAIILRRRFGFETGQPQSLQEVGKYLGLSRERVRQIEKATLQRLRESPLMTQLEDFVIS